MIGTVYVDIGETMHVINTNRPTERSEIRFERRGWFSLEEFKLEGEAYTGEGKKKRLLIQLKVIGTNRSLSPIQRLKLVL